MRRGGHERVELRQHGAVPERAGGAEARKIHGDGAALRAGQEVEHEAPGVGAVRPAVEEHERGALTLQLEGTRGVPGQPEPVLDERLHRSGINPASATATAQQGAG